MIFLSWYLDNGKHPISFAYLKPVPNSKVNVLKSCLRYITEAILPRKMFCQLQLIGCL